MVLVLILWWYGFISGRFIIYTLSWIDWGIVLLLLVVTTGLAWHTRCYMRSVADFLAANRCAGRYLLTVSQGVTSVGLITAIGFFQLYYEAGFTAVWWSIISLPVTTIIYLSGWVLYRYRQTRVLTLSQFFEIRYSRNFRVFMGILAWVSGVINFGIFPAVACRFFINFCGLPAQFDLFGLSISTYPNLLFFLILAALYFTFVGGQITIMVTDFIQGLFMNIALLLILVFVFVSFQWGQVTEALLQAPEGASMLHPFQAGQHENFGPWFFVMLLAISFYTQNSWQGSQGYNCASSTPHEAKMGSVLSIWRVQGQNLLYVVVAVAVFTIMRHPAFSHIAAQANGVLNAIENTEVKNQMTIPVVLGRFLPRGLLGIFCATMVAAFISTHNTYLHSWGSIFIQDVVMPFRKTPFSPKRHLFLLRISICGVAMIIFLFSLLFRQSDRIILFLMLTGAVYLGGAGSAVIGGLYWKKGTTTAAWFAIFTGSILSVSGIIARQFNPVFFLNGIEITFFASCTSAVVYVVTSLLFPHKNFNLEEMLHRGKYARVEDVVDAKQKPSSILHRLGITSEFNRRDKAIYLSTIIWAIFWVVIFVIITTYHFIFGTSTEFWMKFWRIYIWFIMFVSIVATIWLAAGGIIDLKKMFVRLKALKRDDTDDGYVLHSETENCTSSNKTTTFNQ